MSDDFNALIGAAQSDADEVLIDLSGAQDSVPVAPGTYTAMVKSCERGTTKGGANPGAPKLVFKFVITEDGPAKKRVLTKHAMLSGAGAGITRDIIAALGFDVTAGEGGKVRFSPAASVGRACQIVVEAGEKPEWPDIAKVLSL